MCLRHSAFIYITDCSTDWMDGGEGREERGEDCHPSDLPKRIEYKEATLRFGRRRLLIFEVFLGLHRKSEGEEGDTGLCLWQPSYLPES